MTATTDIKVAPPPARAHPILNWANSHPAVLFGLLGLLVAGLYAVNLSISPDFTADEVLYTQLSQHILTFNAISLTGPFLVHPPMDFFLGALWIGLSGSANEPVVSALTSVRVFSAACCVFTALATGILARDVLSGGTPGRRVMTALVATLLVATNGFMLNFGRTALLEPAAIAVGAGIVLVAYRMRDRPAAQQIVLLGLLIGFGTLIKQTVLFVALTPLLAGLLTRSRRRVLIGAAAVAVGGAIWSAFPIWAAVNGHFVSFWNQQSVSIQRLIGALHTSGVTLPNGSPLTQFLRTFGLYASGYASLLVGALTLVTIAVRRGLLSRSPQLDGAIAMILAYGTISYGFLGYSFAFGAGNQQFMMYSAPASALLCTALFFDIAAPGRAGGSVDLGQGDPGGPDSAPVVPNDPGEAIGPVDAVGLGDSADTDVAVAADAGVPEAGDRPVDSVVGEPTAMRLGSARPVAAGIVIALLLLLGLLGWTRYYAIEPDDGTSTIAAYVAASVPRCVPINTSGSQPRWEAALPDNPVRFFRSGPDAIGGGVQLFLLSPKDARYSYGNMSQTLAYWITTNGRLLIQTPSRSSELLQLWAVGDVSAVASSTNCAGAAPTPTASAPAGEFLIILGAVLIVVLTAGGWAIVAAGRRADAAAASDR